MLLSLTCKVSQKQCDSCGRQCDVLCMCVYGRLCEGFLLSVSAAGSVCVFVYLNGGWRAVVGV